ncbi:outer membrane protein assembly factor BamA [Mesorhizobium australicum]|uniref:Outer membrane protein assembly factor BamA n=1 Tax=Mesorhizobium australicum TaxID=536018 RepID=A0A1X7PC04_9HYPH|nr:outer membrane protein assembly factor BamA [Mesorhizobium australicum]SMH48580.1 Beta-barrel assembly machine subunit BamA [Mesorhizobium australicum]
MKATKRLMGAASAAALAAGMVFSASLVVQVAAVSVAEAAVVSSVSVRGNSRVDADTIRGNISIQPGRTFSAADIDESVKRLFATGLFSDVRINQSGGTLIVEVQEYPVVNQVLFQGNKKRKDADLARVVQLKPRGPFSQAQMEADVEAIKAAYSAIGRDDAEVQTQVMDLGENRVNVVFTVNEGGRTKIKSVNFVGNNAFGDRRLGDVISTKRSNMLSFLFRDDIYDENRLRADEEALRRFYYDRGYADFQVVSSSAELDEATNEYTVNFTVDEGERYTFGDVSVETSIEGIDSKSLNSEIRTHSGDVYSAKKVEDTIIGLTEQVAGSGYAFAQVTPRGDRNFETRTISVVYTIDQGPRTYVERIEIRGNERTRDYVIRREFDISEGDAFNQVLIQRAKRRLERLDYFETVNIATAPGSEPDQVILVVDLVEKSTGEFSIGGGYTTGENAGFSVEGSVSERNFLGRGQFIRISAGGGKDTRNYSLSFTEPYFLGRRIAAGFDVYRQTQKYTNYESETTGATIRFGLPITQNLTTQLAYNLTSEEYGYTDDCEPDSGTTTSCDLSPAIIAGIEASPWVKSSVSATLQYNSIDDMKNPHSGIYATLTGEVAGLGGDAKWAKITARGNYYHTLSEQQDIVGLVTLGAGHIQPFDDNGLRVFDQFKGSDRMIRGFAYNGIGPADTNGSTDEDDFDHLGGTTYFHATAEAQFPMPVLPPSMGVKGAVFADAATLFGVDGGVSGVVPGANQASFDMRWRASVGAGLIWASPFGPIRIDYAIPVLKEDTDIVQNLNFGMSAKF